PGGFNGHATALGYGEASTTPYANGTFSGVPVDNDAVLIRYTLAGDSDLSGMVDLTDFTYLAANFNGTGKNWLQGDYDYSGTVDLSDFTYLAANFNQALPAGAGAAGGGGLGAPVPEPAGALIFGAMTAGAMLRRRRRS